jgi:hypothetical protein
VKNECDESGIMKQNRLRLTAIVVVAGLVIGSCLIWQLTNSRVARSETEQIVGRILKEECAVELTNSWQIVNASGGLVGSPLYSIRWWREYFLQAQGNLAAYANLSNNLGSRHSTTWFRFLPPIDYAPESYWAHVGIMPHRDSTNLAPWWQPETNTEPIMSARMGPDPHSVFIYAFKKTTNAVVYVHVIEGW